MPRKSSPPSPPAPASIVVTSAAAGFRRAGRAWSIAPTVVPLADLPEGALAALEAEPMLTVERVPPGA